MGRVIHFINMKNKRKTYKISTKLNFEKFATRYNFMNKENCFRLNEALQRELINFSALSSSPENFQQQLNLLKVTVMWKFS